MSNSSLSAIDSKRDFKSSSGFFNSMDRFRRAKLKGEFKIEKYPSIE